MVLRVDGPSTPHYWRTTTLDVFDDNHWFERLFSLEQVDHDAQTLQLPQLIPSRARDEETWVEQRIRVEALVDDHLAAAGTPVALDARSLGTVFLLSGGVLRANTPVGEGESYRIWSYAPDPAPRSLARAPAEYPRGAATFLEIDGRAAPRIRCAWARARRSRALRRSVIRPLHAPSTHVRRGTPRRRGSPDAVRRCARTRVVAAPDRRLHLRRVAAARAGRSARRVRDARRRPATASTSPGRWRRC